MIELYDAEYKSNASHEQGKHQNRQLDLSITLVLFVDVDALFDFLVCLIRSGSRIGIDYPDVERELLDRLPEFE